MILKSFHRIPPFDKGGLGLPAIGFAFRRGGRGDFEALIKVEATPQSAIIMYLPSLFAKLFSTV
jgi:hypothetical protein